MERQKLNFYHPSLSKLNNNIPYFIKQAKNKKKNQKKPNTYIVEKHGTGIHTHLSTESLHVAASVPQTKLSASYHLSNSIFCYHA